MEGVRVSCTGAPCASLQVGQSKLGMGGPLHARAHV